MDFSRTQFSSLNDVTNRTLNSMQNLNKANEKNKKFMSCQSLSENLSFQSNLGCSPIVKPNTESDENVSSYQNPTTSVVNIHWNPR